MLDNLPITFFKVKQYINYLAKFITDTATGEVEETNKEEKDQANL